MNGLWLLAGWGLGLAGLLLGWALAHRRQAWDHHAESALRLANERPGEDRSCACGEVPMWHPSMQWSRPRGGERWHHTRRLCQPAREVIDRWDGRR